EVDLWPHGDAMRVEAIGRRGLRPLLDQVEVAVEFRYPTRRAACVRAHLGDKEAAFRKWVEVVGDGGKRRGRRLDECGVVRFRDIEEEDSVLPFEQAQEAAAGQRVAIGGEVDMVRLVAGGGDRRRLEDLAVG